MQTATVNEYLNSPLHVEHTLSGLQLRINSAKHMEAGIAMLSSEFFLKRGNEVRALKEVYLKHQTAENAEPLITACEALRRML